MGPPLSFRKFWARIKSSTKFFLPHTFEIFEFQRHYTLAK